MIAQKNVAQYFFRSVDIIGHHFFPSLSDPILRPLWSICKYVHWAIR